jgi:pantoate--beta-alanine ligase
MGALHDGHLALVAEARRRADHVTASVFVNPTQFGPAEDFSVYPRDAEGDAAKLAAAGCDALFLPSVEQMYPFGHDERVWVEVEDLDHHLCGPFRPGHFRGVATVVSKLFHACAPDVAVFGEKDAQQLAILRRMTRALLFPVEVVGVPTLREVDGLARSSRNAYLTPEERAQAPAVYAALQAAKAALDGGARHADALIAAARAVLDAAPLARVQYLEAVDGETLQPVTDLHPDDRVLVATATYFGKTRLIDNVMLTVPGDSTDR